MSEVAVIVGAQFGSEAKGHVTKQVINRHLRKFSLRNAIPRVVNIRVAGPNAGHCAYDAQGRKWALRTVPMGVVFYDEKSPYQVSLHLAAGSEIDPVVLFDELDRLDEAGLNASARLTIDPEATVLLPEHIFREQGMHERMGSTGKGIGACRAARIMREAPRIQDMPELVSDLVARGVKITPTADMWFMHESTEANLIVVEGTQGYGLGLHAGHYPQCTSSDTRAIDFLSMAGINPWAWFVDNLQVYAVARVYPIRVAGNSGPLKDETTWEELGLEAERTTVTQKIRRVGGWDSELVATAVRANGGNPTVTIALTMVDQKFEHVKDIGYDSHPDAVEQVFTDDVIRFIREVERDAGTNVSIITTGEDSALWLD